MNNHLNLELEESLISNFPEYLLLNLLYLKAASKNLFIKSECLNFDCICLYLRCFSINEENSRLLNFSDIKFNPPDALMFSEVVVISAC